MENPHGLVQAGGRTFESSTGTGVFSAVLWGGSISLSLSGIQTVCSNSYVTCVPCSVPGANLGC